MENWQFWGYKSDNEQKIFSKICSQPIISWFALWPPIFHEKILWLPASMCSFTNRSEIHSSAGAGQNGGGLNERFELPDRDGTKEFSLVKDLLCHCIVCVQIWHSYNENQYAQFTAKTDSSVARFWSGSIFHKFTQCPSAVFSTEG